MLTALYVSPAMSSSSNITSTISSLAPISNPIDPSFVGFAVEWYDVPNYFGYYSSKSFRTSFWQALLNLKNLTGTAPRVRMGGGSADDAFWNPTNAPFPYGISFSMTPDTLQVLNETYYRTGIKFSLSVNFLNVSWALEEIQAFGQYMGMFYFIVLCMRACVMNVSV